MSRSPLDQLIAAEREAPPRPSGAQAKESWRRLERSVLAGSAAPFDLPPAAVAQAPVGATWLGVPVKYVLATVLVGGATATAVVATSTPTVPTAPAHPRPSVAEPAVAAAEISEPARTAAPVDPVPVEPAAVEPAAVEPAAVEPAAVEPAEVSLPTPSPSPPAKRPRTAGESPRPTVAPSEAVAPSGIGREIELIKDATAAVQRKAHGRALDILATHAREFPSGALSEDRQALRAIALCGAGRRDAGARAAATFHDEFPKSVHAERVAAACPVENQ